MNYTDHCTEQGFPIPTVRCSRVCPRLCAAPVIVKCTPAVVQEPTILSKFTSCTVASGDPILLSPEASELNFEVELVIVIAIGKHACQK